MHEFVYVVADVLSNSNEHCRDVCRQCLKSSKRSEFSALSARCTEHLSAEKTHSLPSPPPHPSLNVPQRDMWLFLSIPRHSGWLEFDRLGPRGRIVNKGHGMAHADWAAIVNIF